MAYPSPPCPWDEANFPVEVGPKPSPKTLPTIPEVPAFHLSSIALSYTTLDAFSQDPFPIRAREDTHNVLLS